MIVYIKKEFANDELLWEKPYKCSLVSVKGNNFYLLKNEYIIERAYKINKFYTEQEYKSIIRDDKLKKLLNFDEN